MVGGGGAASRGMAVIVAVVVAGLAGCASGGPDARVLGPAPGASQTGPTAAVTPDGRWGSRSDEVCEAVLPAATVARATGLAVELTAQTPAEAGVAPADVTWDVLCSYVDPARGARATTHPLQLDLRNGGTDTITHEPGPMTETTEVGGLPALILDASFLQVMGPNRTAALHLSLSEDPGAPDGRDAALAMGEVVAESLI